ncbi:alkylhydroperoxidase [Burkholderia sp. Bp9002]|nr:alkylhydroperoxidase [Burkholderia sp. Bp9002]
MTTPHAFTFDTLGWRAWLDTVPLAAATPEQHAVLDASHPHAKTSDYYLLLVHLPEILRQRSGVFNAIMYGPGGLPRAERELASTAVSRVNGCVYCASVHAQRFAQLAKRTDAIEQVFDDPATAGTTAREQAIVRYAIALTDTPDAVDERDIAALEAAGLTHEEILDLSHAIAIFAWANRLMLTLGEPVASGQAGKI